MKIELNGSMPKNIVSQQSTGQSCEIVKMEKESQPDRWLGITHYPTRDIKGTPFFMSRMDAAKEPTTHPQRLNRHGYDRDNPNDAITKYEKAHPLSLGQQIWNGATDLLFNFCTLFIPKALSLSAGDNKQRIDQKIVLNIVRNAVDKFPELKIRISKEAFDLMDAKDQVTWHRNMSIIRAAQHDYIIQEMSKAYPGHIDPNPPTILYTGGRATGLLKVLYCSVDEYVAIYWSDWGLMSTDSGSYRAHVYDYITEGQNINWNGSFLEFKPNDFETTEPGEYTFLGQNDRKIWSFEGPCGMVDHGIGDIPSMLKFALVSNFTSTLNMDQVGNLLTNQAKAVAYEYMQRLKESFGFTSVIVEASNHVSAEDLAMTRHYFAKILERAPKEEPKSEERITEVI